MSLETASITSSIGPKWPPDETSFKRIKGFYDLSIIDSEAKLNNLLTEVEYIAQSVSNDTVPATRLSIRAITQNNILTSENPRLHKYGEAVIPLQGSSPHFEDTSILYLGYNSDSRQSDVQDLQDCIENYQAAHIKKSLPASQIIERVIEAGYELNTISAPISDTSLVSQLAEIYSRFDWTLEQVEEILTNPNNFLTYASFEGRVVSAGLGEFNKITIGDEKDDLTLKIIELTEAATVTEHQGQGLYSAVATKGLVELAKGSVPFIKDGVDLVYGECNGHNQGVLKAARYQGRTFAAEAAQKMKLPFNGLLLQHVPIFGSSKISEYNNLLPAFLSRATLNEFAKG
ncbi:MAG: hypothetical protein ACD_30C00112G0012 [uncultured bacterium]|uniref:Uncharacterized protein n=3 Tax=Candidatus Daviesiibacteriota TaxID=1752718 RepID=A0A1F5K4R1_9BACT|nr:MAG: hypothetical protein ACD_30C00112G0012 [uncultured bacterium]KKQ15311.1 MAG: hypothetical protein US28_C0019G0044 [Candidatus Daviesbacteria bacterium GW2011_GWA1_36_8]OGE17172.1 MAG: hypothetical protein A2858_00515 [Candidatus Daviesbacteria bacterium RIFCSPHIGHO2_01_FULL_36_37]OGE35953.1 MAG: hypothetical protein A3E66_01510 [Candidatus Daviesbacteria bacterium RIFCSPHIGHO2_12_FULL_37_16]